MATAGFTNGFTFNIGDGASSEVFTRLEEIRDISGFGKTNPLIEAGSFDSAAQEYIAGLPDGSEFTVNCIRVHTASSQQDALMSTVDAGEKINLQFILNDGATSKTYSFAAIGVGYEITPSYQDITMINFTLRISGAITES